MRTSASRKAAAAKEADFIPVKSLPGIVLDDIDAKLEGEWRNSTNFKPCIGNGYRVHGAIEVRNDGKATATFRVKVPRSGEYQIAIAYSAHETRANTIPVSIVSGGRETKFIVDQTKPLPNGDRFQIFGTIELKEEDETTLQIQTRDTTGFVILDAVQLIWMKH